ncbi:hypothetical protein Gotri_021617, partial [Gossypium trilobum]|nr:hypothetical protein [Gossypium trilobum]
MSAMKRKPVQQKSQIRWKRKVLAALLVLLCFASLVLMETQYPQVVSLSSLRHRFIVKPKIAFLFIARNRLPLDMVWDAFFKGEENRFSVYVHSRPGFLLNKGTTRSAYFLNRQVNDSIQVDWGEATMIEAERILLRHALTDPYNERFVFVSDSSFADTKEGRYNPKMDPVIPVYNWRKGSQPADPAKEHNCIPDEHYVQTLLAQEGFEGEITRRSLTYSAWDLSASKDRERRGWHPVTYKFSDATPVLIKSIKDIDNINYETENRREWCSSKGKPAPCFLFARKFTRPAALHLLNL